MKKVRAPKNDADHMGAPCIIVRGKRRDFEDGETVIVQYGDRDVPGCVRTWHPMPGARFGYGFFSVQVRPLPEGPDALCVCRPPLVDDYCAYHSEMPATGLRDYLESEGHDFD